MSLAEHPWYVARMRRMRLGLMIANSTQAPASPTASTPSHLRGKSLKQNATRPMNTRIIVVPRSLPANTNTSRAPYVPNGHR